ncbi:MAG: DUF1178 family protein [Rhodospirillales bacterium]
MIVFNLRCDRGHTFEEWFASGADYENKAAAHEVVCPDCGDTHVVKALSAPRINAGAAAPAAATPCGLPACAGGTCAMMDPS